MATKNKQRQLALGLASRKQRYKLYKSGKTWLVMGLATVSFGLLGSMTGVSAATTSTATVTNVASSTATAGNATAEQATISTATQKNASITEAEPASTTNHTANTAVAQTVKTTDLGDASDAEIASAKRTATADYAATGQPQEITAVKASGVNNQGNVTNTSGNVTNTSDLATAKTPSGDPVASADGTSYYYSGTTSPTLNIVKHYKNSSAVGWSSSPSGAIPLTQSGVPVINASTIFHQIPVTKLSGGADAAAVLESLDLGSAVEYWHSTQDEITTRNLTVHVGDVTYADGSAVNINQLKFSETIPERIKNEFQGTPNTAYAFLTVDLWADGTNYRTVKTVTVPIADQEPVIHAAQGLHMTQRASDADIISLLGATATDAEDGPLNVSVIGSRLKQDTPGTYKVELSATDKNGVTTTITTTVTVTAKPEIVIPVEYEDADTGATVHAETDAVTDYDTAGAITTYLVDGYTLTSEVLNMADTSGQAKSVVADFTTNTLNYYSGLNGQGEVVATQDLKDLTSDKWAAMGINQSPAGTVYLGYGDSPKDIVSGYNTANAIGSIKFLYTKDATTAPTDDTQSKTAVPDAVSVTADDYYDNTKTDTPTGEDDQFKDEVPDAISVATNDYYDNTKMDTPTGEGVYIKKVVPDAVAVTADNYYNNAKTDTPTGETTQFKAAVPDAVAVTADNYYNNAKTDTPTGETTQFKAAVPDAVAVTADNYYNNAKTDTPTGETTQFKAAVPDAVAVTADDYYDNTKTDTPTNGTNTIDNNQFTAMVPDAVSVTANGYYNNTQTNTPTNGTGATDQNVQFKADVPEAVAVTKADYYDRTNTPATGHTDTDNSGAATTANTGINANNDAIQNDTTATNKENNTAAVKASVGATNANQGTVTSTSTQPVKSATAPQVKVSPTVVTKTASSKQTTLPQTGSQSEMDLLIAGGLTVLGSIGLLGAAELRKRADGTYDI